MKTKSHFLVLSIFALALFTSCDPNAVDENTKTNYWNSSTLIRLHLYDKVKTVTIDDDGMNVLNFNQDGFLTTEVRSSGAGVATTTFIYASSGELTRTDFSSTMSTPTVSYSTNFQYQDNGKFVIAFPIPEHLVMVGEFQALSGLVPNLKSTSMSNGGYNSTTSYTFNGDKLTILTISQGDQIYKDTAVATYNGKYPISLFNGGSYASNISYTSNGMFKAVTIGYEGSSNTTTHYFKADNTFLLKDSVVENIVNDGISSKMVKTYTYDSNKNVTLEESPTNSTKYEYEYDSHKNWTTKTTRYKYQGATEWGTPYTETRTITYW